jgi:hypothetical protein
LFFRNETHLYGKELETETALCNMDPTKIILENVGRNFHGNYSCQVRSTIHPKYGNCSCQVREMFIAGRKTVFAR